jgi:replicative DNA helicase
MPALKRRKVDSTIEKRIVTGMIVSKKFLQEISGSVNPDYFENTFTRQIAEWSLHFYLQYEEASRTHIQDIFNKEKDRLSKEDADLISKLLVEISKRYESSDGINVEYLLDQTLAYFKKRELEMTASNIQYLLSRNKIDEAEDEVIGFRKVSRITSNWTNPFDAECVNEVFEQEEDFFRFPGDLGNFTGPFERNWLVAVSGTFKKGKTWLLQEFAVIGMMRKLKVAFFSLEMPKKKMNERIYKRMIGAAPEEGVYEFPCFDCFYNQDGSCESTNRTNRHTLRNSQGHKPEYDPDSPYRACTYCKDHGRSSDYKIDFWFTPPYDDRGNLLRTKAFKLGYIKQRISKLRKHFKDYLRLKCYPRFSANMHDITRDLDILEQTEGFVPDIIIIDYADILKPEREGLSGTEKEDETWMKLSQLGGTRHALVVTATQLRRSALEKTQVKQSDSALWIGKLAHVDVMLSLNQSENEKDAGAMRIGIMVHRFKEFSEEANCYILQKLSFGQVNLESYASRK